MKFVFFNHDGNAVSGVFTYGKLLRAHHPDCILVSLNDDTPCAAEDDGGIIRLPFEKSHDIAVLVQVIVDIAGVYSREPLILLPNNGTVPFLACIGAINALPDQRHRIRILAIAHSDHPDSYALAVQHESYVAAFAGVSKTLAQRFRKALPHRAEIFCLPYAVRLPPAPRIGPQGNEPLRLLYAGRLEESQKRVSRLPRVARRLSENGIPFALDFYGEGSVRAQLERELEGLPGIRFIGAIPAKEMAERMQSYDILLLVSAYEGTPIVVIEAMAAGLCPVVMAIESGLPELIRDGENGCVVAQGDTEAMAQAIASLDHDRLRLDAIRRAARKTVIEKHSLSGHLALLAAVLERCIRAPAPQPCSMDSPFDSAIEVTLERADRTARTTVVWGGGMYGRHLVDICIAMGLSLTAIIDRDPWKQGRCYRGIPYLPRERLPTLKVEQILVGSLAFAAEIELQIQNLFAVAGVPCPRIILPA